MVAESEVIEKLKGIIDPHTAVSVYDMGLISDLKVAGSDVSLIFTPSSPFCPLGVQLAVAIKKGLKEIGVEKAEVTVKGHVQEAQLNSMLKTL
ncbi:MAG: DUF59 domain-containing protein [Euryarchaeota archaeon]|nr:DUF59 domain-containing protein [Euryarchaeota archaeon]